MCDARGTSSRVARVQHVHCGSVSAAECGRCLALVTSRCVLESQCSDEAEYLASNVLKPFHEAGDPFISTSSPGALHASKGSNEILACLYSVARTR